MENDQQHAPSHKPHATDPLTVIEPENETSWNRAFSNFNENRHKDGNLGLHDYEGHKIVIFFNSGKISISGT